MGKWQAMAFAAFALGACLHGRHGGPELVGKWTTATTAPDGVHGTTATYHFKDDGSFEMSGYPPIEVTGRWSVVERQPGKLRLKLSEQEMKAPHSEKSRWNDEEDWAELTQGNRSFRFKGKVFNKN